MDCGISLPSFLFHTLFVYTESKINHFIEEFFLYQVTAGLLDVVYPSEDKDKVSPLLVNILTRVFPYLKNHRYLDRKCYQFVMSTFICHTLFVCARVRSESLILSVGSFQIQL